VGGVGRPGELQEQGAEYKWEERYGTIWDKVQVWRRMIGSSKNEGRY
jgi:hypothetical protein